MAGVYWIGQDGNIWYKDSGGTRNMGPAGANVARPDASGFYDPWADNNQEAIRFDATQIADPTTAGKVTAPTSAPALNQAAINNTQLAIDQIPGLLQAAIEAENQRYRNTVSGFDTQEQGQRKTYDESSTTNQLNYDQNYMDSVRAGIKGLGGLMNILRGTGAAGSSAEGDVRDVVGGVTSNDIRAGADTRNENQGQLDSTLSAFLTDLGLKRKQNEDTRVNNERAIRRDSATSLQDLYGKMAGYFGDAGRTADRDVWMSRAGALTPEIATNSNTRVSNYDTTPVAIKAPEITAFAAPSQPNAIAAPSDGQVGSGIFSISDRRRERQAAPAGV